MAFGLVDQRTAASVQGRPAPLRSLLYLPTVVATRYNPHIQALYLRRLACGKTKMAALGAAKRKLAHLCFGVIPSGQPYCATYDPKKA